MKKTLWITLGLALAIVCVVCLVHIPASLHEPPTPYLTPGDNEKARYLDTALDAAIGLLAGFGARGAWRRASSSTPRRPRKTPRTPYKPGGSLFDD